MQPDQEGTPEDTEEKTYEPYQHGIKPGTSSVVTPLKHVQMFQRHFTKEKLDQAVAYLKSDGASVAPLFVVVDTRGNWSFEGTKLFWQANDGSTQKLEVISHERLQDFMKQKWYQQDIPSGIESLHKFLCLSFLGISIKALRTFIRQQKPWQMIRNKPSKGKQRLSMLAKRPFGMVEIDIADMVSFEQTVGKEHPRYILVLVDNFSGFCFGEVQFDKESPTTLVSLKKMLDAITELGYKPPYMMRSDQGPEFQGPDWDLLDAKLKWRRERTKNYPAVRAERKIQTLKRYCRLNSTLTRGPKTYWWNVVQSSVKAVNNIYQPKGGSPRQIILMDLEERKTVHGKAKDQRAARQQRLSKKPLGNEPKIGDSVRVSLLAEKELPRDYKGHIAYKQGVPVKWSDEIFVVEKKLRNKTRGSVKFLVGGRWRFWPSEVQLIPENTVDSSVMGQDGNVDWVKPRAGKRKSSRKRKPRQVMDL